MGEHYPTDQCEVVVPAIIQNESRDSSNQTSSSQTFLYIVILYEGNMSSVWKLFHIRFRLYVYIDLFMYVIYLDGYLSVANLQYKDEISPSSFSLFQAS